MAENWTARAAELGFSDAAAAEVPADASNAGEAISALVVLGYSQSEAASVIMKLDSSLSVEELIKAGLRALSSR